MLEHARRSRPQPLPFGLSASPQILNGGGLDYGMPCGIEVEGRPVPSVGVAVERRRLVDLPEVTVLRQESSEFRVEVPGLGVVEAGLLVVDVSGEGEAVGGAGQLLWESEVAPGVLGN